MSLHFGKLSSVGELSSFRIGSPTSERSLVDRRRLGAWAARWLVCCVLGSAPSYTGCTPTAADTVDLGDNPETPDVSLDENFFHCQVQPQVISAQGCSAGGPGEAGSCHSARSALRLVDVPVPSVCQNNRLIGQAAAESVLNLERIRSSVGADADSSPLYRRPLGLDSHPRMIFTSDSPPALLLRLWLNGQATP
ncbi:MAG: hypothetical protein JWN04_5076 [Myxococcaceae bacterium]|nr:hypothetical protein [Myxococcaceae bacterium]